MQKPLQILLLFVFIVNCVQKTFANNCDAFDNLKRAFNLGEHVFLQYSPKSYLKFDSQHMRLVDQKYSLDSIFGGKQKMNWTRVRNNRGHQSCTPQLTENFQISWKHNKN